MPSVVYQRVLSASDLESVTNIALVVCETYGLFLGPVCRALERGLFCPVADESREAATEVAAELDIAVSGRERMEARLSREALIYVVA